MILDSMGAEIADVICYFGTGCETIFVVLRLLANKWCHDFLLVLAYITETTEITNSGCSSGQEGWENFDYKIS